MGLPEVQKWKREVCVGWEWGKVVHLILKRPQRSKPQKYGDFGVVVSTEISGKEKSDQCHGSSCGVCV